VLEVVDENEELPSDPKVKKFGNKHSRPISVRFEYTSDKDRVLDDLTEFLYKNAKLMKFSENTQNDCWKCILKAIINV
jgi:hypothetical protein